MKAAVTTVTSFIQYVPKRAAIVGAVALGVLTTAASAAAWGPSRDSYTVAHPANHVVFDSITNNPKQGDERDFMQVKRSAAADSAYGNSVSVTPSSEYTVFIYFDNDAASSLSAAKQTATGAYVKAALPGTIKAGQKNVNADGFVGANNATPKAVFDDVTFANPGSSDLTLTYEKGSAAIHGNGNADGSTLSDSIVSSGAPIGYDTLNGMLKGGSRYAGYVTFKVKTSAAPIQNAPIQASADFTVQKSVRVTGAADWYGTATAKPGDTVQYLVTYKNTGSATQNNVVLKDTLPQGLTYVPGSTSMSNVSTTAGMAASKDGITGANGLNIGSYAKGGVAYVEYSAVVGSTLPCGANTFTNTVHADSGSTEKTATATVTANGQCATNTTAPSQTTPPASTPAQSSTSTQSATAQSSGATATASASATASAAPADTSSVQTQATASASPAPANATAQPLTATGPVDVVGSLAGTSGLGLGIHHYIQSRRTLRNLK